jgi:hypothetical protein
MTFLNSALLPGLVLLVGLPLLIHLLNLQFPRLFEFSSVKHIRATIAQRSRIFRWRHLLLLLLRTLFLVLLLLAFLRPLIPRFGSAANQQTGRAVLIVLDHSLSMEHKGGGVSSRQRAEAEADKILATLGADDTVNVITAGQAAKSCFFELSRNHAEAKRFVAALKPGLGRADFTQANVLAARLLAPSKDRPEIYYLSDFQRRNWANVDFTALPPAARLFFVDVAPPKPDNRAILGASINQSQVLAGDTVTLEVEIGNFRDQPLQESLKVVLDARTSFEKEVAVAPWSTAKVTLPVPPGGPGLHQCEISFTPDDLALDDRFSLTIPVMEKEGILIVSDVPDPQKDAVLFLKTALNPYDNFAGSLLPEHVPAAGVTSAKLATVRKIFFTRTGRLNDAAAKLVAEFIFHGGGVVYFLDGERDAVNLAALEKAIAAPLPLKLGARRVAKNVGTGAQQIIKGDFKSRYLRLFRGANRQNLALLEFYDLYDAGSTGAGSVLLTYADDTPAMASLNHGLGTMLFMNFSVGEFSSNLARQRIFPAWMQEIVKNITSDEPLPSSSLLGDPVSDEVWKSELEKAPMRKPSGELLEVKTEPLGERAGISFVPDELGFYTIRAGGKLLHAYGVNPSSDESDLRPIDRSLLPEQLSEKGQRGFFVQGREDFDDLILGKPIFHWFVLAAVALLVVELAFQFLLQRTATKQP